MLRSLLDGIQRTEQRLREFEKKYQLSTEEFLQRYQNDEFEETLELDGWIGEYWMLKSWRQEVEELKLSLLMKVYVKQLRDRKTALEFPMAFIRGLGG